MGYNLSFVEWSVNMKQLEKSNTIFMELVECRFLKSIHVQISKQYSYTFSMPNTLPPKYEVGLCIFPPIKILNGCVTEHWACRVQYMKF